MNLAAIPTPEAGTNGWATNGDTGQESPPGPSPGPNEHRGNQRGLTPIAGGIRRWLGARTGSVAAGVGGLGQTWPVHLVTVVQAAGMFVATNIDDLVVLMVFFGRARGDRAATIRVVGGQYLGFVAILLVSLAGAFGVRLLPGTAVAYFGLLPIVFGIRAAWSAWRHRGDDGNDWDVNGQAGVGISTVAAVTFANGGDNIGVYVPVFAAAGPSGMPAYVVTFLIGVGLWCVVSQRIASHPGVAHVLERWEHVLLPAVLIGIGAAILIQGGAFGL